MNFNTLSTNVRDRLRMLPVKPDDYLKHIIDTYFSTRFGIGIIGLAFPIILWSIGLKFGVPLQGSISAYYHTPMRNVFVGILFAIGASLFLYKGYGTTEDFVLDAAGILALCVALLPTSPATKLSCDTFTAPLWHGISAVLFFVLIAGICIAEAFGKLYRSKIPQSQKSKGFFTKIYWILGIGMIVLPVVSALWLYFIGETGSLIFWVETAGVVIFSTYWMVKSIEINESGLEKMYRFGVRKV